MKYEKRVTTQVITLLLSLISAVLIYQRPLDTYRFAVPIALHAAEAESENDAREAVCRAGLIASAAATDAPNMFPYIMLN